MTVAELIEELKKYQQNADVVLKTGVKTVGFKKIPKKLQKACK